jgi:hypothetical protein
VLIKAVDNATGWLVLDSARGVSGLTDPYLLLNSNSAEATSSNILGVYAPGFAINGTAATVNGSGLNYIYLAIA